MEVIKVRYVDGYDSHGVPVSVAYRELQRIQEEHGELTSQLVLEEARDKRSPIRKQVFDLPKNEAAEAHYRSNAARLIRSISVRYADAPEIEVRAFHVRYEQPTEVKGRTFGVFDSVDAILADPLARAALLDRALREAESWKRRYGRLDELAGVVMAIDDLHDKRDTA